MNDIRFNELLEYVRHLKRVNHETYDSLRRKGPEFVKVENDKLGFNSLDDESVDIIMETFKILNRSAL